MAFQAIWVVGTTFTLWFALVKTYSASKLSAFTFITPLFGVVGSYFIMHDTLSLTFGAAAVLVIAGLFLVNRPSSIRCGAARCIAERHQNLIFGPHEQARKHHRFRHRGPGAASQHHPGQGRRRRRRRRCADRRAVDDQHRHRRYRRHHRPGRSACARRLRNGPHHRGPRGGRCRRPAHPRRPAQARHHHAADRRLPLYRPQAARGLSGLRRGARQISHQSRQCRLQGQARHPVRRHHRDREQEQQAGPHRRQLGFARSGTADQADGRERRVRQSARCARGDARGHGAVGAALGRARRRARHAQEPHHPVGQGLGGAGSDRGLRGSRQPFRLRDPSRPDRGRHGHQGHRGVVGRARHPACSRASATPSASR